MSWAAIASSTSCRPRSFIVRAFSPVTQKVPRSPSSVMILASQPEREVIRLARVGFIPYTAHTIVRVDLLLEELSRVRRRGFATAFGEHEASINAVAVPVFDQRAGVVAALEIRASGNRITPSRVPELVERAREAAAIITDHIGGVIAGV